ncbi:MAG: class I SAM-dependent methyltransferase [Pirellulaceae bacterium]
MQVRYSIRLGLVTAVALSYVTAAVAQEKSVNPGINDSFQAPNVSSFVERFEKEGREVYDRREAIVAACEVKPGMLIADVGAGTGLFTRLFAEQVGPEGRVYAVDIARNFVDHVRDSSRAAGLNNVIGVVASGDSTNLPPNSVDVVFICDTYHHFEFPHKTMSSIHRALRPGGTVVLIDFERVEGESSDWILGHVRAGQEVFEKEVAEAGFEKIDERDLLKDNYFTRFKKVMP